MKMLRQTQAWGSPGMGKSVDGNTMKLNRRAFPFGIGSHASSSLAFRINGAYKRFHATVGLDDESACGDGVTWIVRADQKILWKSDVLTAQMQDSLSIDVSGVQVLELEAEQGATNNCDHADWLNPWLE